MKKCCPAFPIAFVIIFAVGAFIYYQYSFSAISKIDFSQFPFYYAKEKEVVLFEPKKKQYQLCFFSSNQERGMDFLKEQQIKNPKEEILAVDLYQKDEKQTEGIVFLRIGSKTLLGLIHQFELRDVPQCFFIRQSEESPMLYQRPKEIGIYKLLNFKQQK